MREVVVVGYDDVALMDVAGPVEVFEGAGGYRVRLATVGGGPMRATAGLRVLAEDLADVDGPVDTLLVVGGFGFEAAATDEVLIGHVRRLAAGARRVAGVCTGAWLLAAAGLLDGGRATTHWAFCAKLARLHPTVEVVPNAIFVRHGRITTSAGVTAGIDLSLALVADDHGQDVAREIARWMVVFLQRPGGQSQFSVRSSVPTVRSEGLRVLLDAIAADPTAAWTVADMAHRAAMSTRHLARVFPRQVGLPPAQYVERARVEFATGLLDSGDEALDVVARRSGFGSPETLRRAFQRVIGVSPGGYRSRFRTTG
ncbi:GlxA family transcriptional regulator [Umezawaea endophytica]|uniref:DJ-1/PfpI family protein n=1 Tax=Umezawaea endophytica TaxID=1654476 RepID=A0A9X3A3S3_9PSEU|nr:DJ-1/PfpI family protein [Umezawaea endophytica]MCS7482054.1 DJ-1/PfpI family protein [Umezawaea endophytica]